MTPGCRIKYAAAFRRGPGDDARRIVLRGRGGTSRSECAYPTTRAPAREPVPASPCGPRSSPRCSRGKPTTAAVPQASFIGVALKVRGADRCQQRSRSPVQFCSPRGSAGSDACPVLLMSEWSTPSVSGNAIRRCAVSTLQLAIEQVGPGVRPVGMGDPLVRGDEPRWSMPSLRGGINDP